MSNREDLMYLVSLIATDEIREFTKGMLGVVPGTFWTAKASRSHHPADERGDEGNLLHTVRVARLCVIMGECCQLGQLDADIVLSAAILHDPCRYGLDGMAEYSVEEHPMLVRELANIHNISCIYDDDIFKHIERHMGIWGITSYLPDMSPYAILHIADVLSARSEEVWGVARLEVPEWHGGVPFKDLGMTSEMMDLLPELAENNDYWAAVSRFIRQVSSRKLSSLTVNQRNWLSDIVAQLSVELDRRTAKEVFRDEQG